MTSSDMAVGDPDRARPERVVGDDDRPLVPDRGDGDRDEAWGDTTDDRDAADRRLWDDRPPHHDGRRSW